MRKHLLDNFWCEVQRKKHVTRFYQLQWSADLMMFEQYGAELVPGDYIVAIFANGEPILNIQCKIRRSTKTIIGLWVGGLNPHKPKGKHGIITFQGDMLSLLDAIKNTRMGSAHALTNLNGV
ncbi:MAG: hypothetical protein JSS66_07560 [Armatimonadetes bacterium]|nr:hypothetical protein [Armatimonadota bacterium]